MRATHLAGGSLHIPAPELVGAREVAAVPVSLEMRLDGELADAARESGEKGFAQISSLPLGRQQPGAWSRQRVHLS